MAGRKLKKTKRFKKDFKNLDEQLHRHVEAVLTELAQGSLSPGRDDKLRKATKRGVRQVRVVGGYRLTYELTDEYIRLLRVGSHDEIERRDC